MEVRETGSWSSTARYAARREGRAPQTTKLRRSTTEENKSWRVYCRSAVSTKSRLRCSVFRACSMTPRAITLRGLFSTKRSKIRPRSMGGPPCRSRCQGNVIGYHKRLHLERVGPTTQRFARQSTALATAPSLSFPGVASQSPGTAGKRHRPKPPDRYRHRCCPHRSFAAGGTGGGSSGRPVSHRHNPVRWRESRRRPAASPAYPREYAASVP